MQGLRIDMNAPGALFYQNPMSAANAYDSSDPGTKTSFEMYMFLKAQQCFTLK